MPTISAVRPAGIPRLMAAQTPPRYPACNSKPASATCSIWPRGQGARQILALHIPGDPVDLQNLLLGESDHSVQTVGRAEVAFVDHWYDDAGFVATLAERVRGTSSHVVFTAHSLPARVLDEGDPYQDQLLSTARLVAVHR